MEHLIVDHVEYEDVKTSEVISFLSRRSKELDPEGKGIDIQLILDKDDNPSITMLCDDIPISDTISYVCRGANLKYRILNDKVIIASQNIPLDTVETRFFPIVDSSNINNIGNDVELYLKKKGELSLKGTSAGFCNDRKLLRITQASPEFEKMKDIIAFLCGYRTKFIFDKSSPVAAKIANLKQGDFVEVKGEMQIKEAKFNGYPFPQPCFLIKDIEAIRNPVLPKLRKYEPAQ